MKHQKIEHHRRAKLPPLLEIDEDGLPVFELDTLGFRHWSADGDATDLHLGERPADFDD